MLGFVSRFGSSKGMVLMPDLSGLTLTQAQTSLQDTGLNFNGNYLENTSNSSLNAIVKAGSQNIVAGTLIDYGTSVSFITYNYVYVPPAVTLVSTTDSGCIYSDTPTTVLTCSGTTATYTTTTPKYGIVTRNYSDGTSTNSRYDCAAVISTSTQRLSLDCGYEAPAPCTYSTSSSTGTCSGGYATVTTTTRGTDCSITTSYSQVCCSSTSTTYGSWSLCVCSQRSRSVTTTTTCGSSTTTSTTTQTASCTGGLC